MFEYIFTGILAAILIILYCLVNSKTITGKIVNVFTARNALKGMSRHYMERFREHRQTRLSRNILIQAFPWFCVLALVYILSNQYFIFGTVLTGSMVPTFDPGDMVLMQTFDKKVKVGEIAMFPMYGFREPVTHRVVEINEYGNIITKGDANPTIDNNGFPPERIVGKAVVIGGQPIVLKGFGYYVRPENIGKLQVMNKLPTNFVIARAFQQFQAVQPLIIFFATVFYFFILIESRMEYSRRFNKGKNGGKDVRERS